MVRNRSMRKSQPTRSRVLIENLEQRALFSVTGASAAEAVVGDLMKATAVGAVSTIPVVGGIAEAALGWALGMAGQDPQQEQFDQVNAKIDKLADDVTHLQASVNDLSNKLDVATRDALINTIPLAEVKTAQFAFEDYLNAPTKPERLAAKDEFMEKAKHLDVAIQKFEDAFQGTGGKTNLMEAFSAVLKNNAPTAPFLTNANYTAPLQQVYRFYKDYEALALNMRVEYLHAKNLPNSARSIVHRVNNNLTIDASTMPKPIPHYGTYDTRTGFLWATFDTGGMNYYIAKHNFADFVSGNAAMEGYLFNNTTQGAAAAKNGRKAYDAQVAENKRLGIGGFFKWRLPNAWDVNTIKSPDQSSDAAVRGYMGSHGFNVNITNYQIWTLDMFWHQRYVDMQKGWINNYISQVHPKPVFGEVTSVAASTVAGRSGIVGSNANWHWYHSNHSSATMNSGVQPQYMTELGVGYADAKKVSAI